MFLKPLQYRKINNFCMNSNCPLKSIAKRLNEVRMNAVRTTERDIVQISDCKTKLKQYEDSLGRSLDLSNMVDAQRKTDSICNSLSLNKTLDCIHDEISYLGEQAFKKPEIKEYVAAIDKALFEEIPKTTKDILLYRGESFSPHSRRLQEISTLKSGDTLNSDRYIYLTDKLQYAENFQRNNQVKVLYKVLVPKNSNIALTTRESGCAIAPRNSTHRVVDIEHGIGQITITSILDTGSKPI